MEVDVAAVSVLVFGIAAVKPEDAGEDGIGAGFSFPDSSWEAAFEAGVERSSFADAFLYDEVARGGAKRAFFKAEPPFAGGDGGLEEKDITLSDFQGLAL